MKSYVSKIQELEGELLRLQNLNGSKVVDCLELDDDALHSRDSYFANLHDLSSGSGTKDVDINGNSKSYEFPIICMVHDLDSCCSLSCPFLNYGNCPHFFCQRLDNGKKNSHLIFVPPTPQPPSSVYLQLIWKGIVSSLLIRAGEAEDQVKELEHSSLQEKLDMELKELDKKLEQKEVSSD